MVSEIVLLRKRHGLRAVLFRDPIFTLSRERTVEMAEALRRAGTQIEYACETRLDYLDKELVDLLHACGLRALNVGIEAFSDAVLKSSKRKPVEKEHQEAIIAYAKEKGIHVSAFFILGFPGDTEDTIRQTIEYAVSLNVHVAQFTLCTPYPGTLFYKSVENRIFEKDFEEFNAYTPVYQAPYVTPSRLLELKDYAYRRYYLRPRWMWLFLRETLGY